MVSWGGRVAVIGGRGPFAPGGSEPRLDGAVLDPSTGQWNALPDLPAGDQMMAPGLVAAAEHDGRLIVVRLVTGEAYALDPPGSEWRSLGSAGLDVFVEPVGIAGRRWLFASSGGPERPDIVAAVLDLTSGHWAQVAAPTGITEGYLSAGAGDTVLAMAGRWSHDTAPPLALSWQAATGTWTELPPPPLAHRIAAAVAWTGSELLVWGGASTGGFGGPSFSDGAAFHS